jgi:hypothetical protein
MAADAAIKDLTQLIMSYGDNYRKAFITRRCTHGTMRARERERLSANHPTAGERPMVYQISLITNLLISLPVRHKMIMRVRETELASEAAA